MLCTAKYTQINQQTSYDFFLCISSEAVSNNFLHHILINNEITLFQRVMDEGEAGGAHYTFDFEYDKEKSEKGQESKKKYLSRVKSTLRIVLQVR